MSVPSAMARRDITDYAAALNIPDVPRFRSLDDSAVSFPALALAADEQTIPVIHSDFGFESAVWPAGLGGARVRT